MKVLLGQMFRWRDNPCPALYIDGVGTIEGSKDKDYPLYNCAILNRRQLIKLKNLIEKELDMMSSGKGRGNVNPYNKRQVKNAKKAFSKTEKTVKPVAKDTNKTRRSIKKPTKGK